MFIPVVIDYEKRNNIETTITCNITVFYAHTRKQEKKFSAYAAECVIDHCSNASSLTTLLLSCIHNSIFSEIYFWNFLSMSESEDVEGEGGKDVSAHPKFSCLN